jgi:hypothetical protein
MKLDAGTRGMGSLGNIQRTHKPCPDFPSPHLFATCYLMWC